MGVAMVSPAGGHLNVEVGVLETVRVNSQQFRMRANVGKGGLGALFHYLAQLPGEGKLALAGGPAHFQEDYVASDRRPGQSAGDPGLRKVRWPRPSPWGMAAAAVTNAGSLSGCERWAKGRLIFNALQVLPHVDRHPTADRLLLNVISFARERV